MGVGRKLWETAPRDVARKMRRRIFGERMDPEEILRTAKNSSPQLFYNFFARYEAILARTQAWEPLAFANRTVLEIGCGPMLGFGPLAIFRGCKSFVAIEPEFRRDVTYHDKADLYYLAVHKDLSAIYGPLLDFETFRGRLRERVTVVPQEVAKAPQNGDADIVLSNSALEHLFPLPESVAAIAAMSRENARFMHLVDFGNHRSSPSPFHGMYSTTPDEYLRMHGKGINLARGSDVLAAFSSAGVSARLQPYIVSPELYAEQIHPWWTARYSADDLFLKTGLVFSPAT